MEVLASCCVRLVDCAVGCPTNRRSQPREAGAADEATQDRLQRLFRRDRPQRCKHLPTAPSEGFVRRPYQMEQQQWPANQHQASRPGGRCLSPGHQRQVTRTVMVGDADTDAGTARAAGTPLILVDFGYTEIPAVELAPDILLHHFDDIVDACTDLFNKSLPVSRAVGT